MSNDRNRRNPSVLLAFDWSDRRLYKGIMQFATEHTWHVSAYLLSGRYTPYGWSGDGAITCYGKALAPFINSLNMPAVDISVCDTPIQIPKAITDNKAVGRMAAEHFLERGFRNFAYYSWPSVAVNVLRRRAFTDALEQAGVEKSDMHIILQSPNSALGDWERHQHLILEQVRRLPRPLAVFTGQDNLGANLIDICVRNGINVPEEVAVLGVDNMEFICDCLAVPMSSIDTQLDRLGYEAAMQLARLMRGEIDNKAPAVLIPPKGVVCRQSSDILAVPHRAVRKALAFIKENYGQNVSLENMTQCAGMSKRGLEKAFLKHLGRSPSVELRRVRLHTAKRMLTETDDKIEYIARICGYSNSSNLSFAFNKETGMSPRAYRRTCRRRDTQGWST